MSSRKLIACTGGCSLMLNVLVCIAFFGFAAGPATGQVDFAPPVTYATSTSPWSLTTGDFNLDGYADIATAGWQLGEVSVHFNDQSGAFGTGIAYDVGETTAGGCVAADLNNDGWDDIATSNLDWNNVSVLLNNQNGTFAPAVLYPVGSRSWNVEAGDLNGDGWIDLVASNVLTEDVSVLLNNQNGTFAPAVSYAAEQSTIDSTIADLDGDTVPDIGVANFSFSSLSVLFNNGNGTFQPRQKWSAGGGSRGIVAVDLDRDGDNDLVTANSLDDNITIRLNDGFGQFSARFDVPAGTWCYQLAAPDVDLDADPDLLVVNNSPAGVTLLKNHGDGNLAPPVFFETAAAGSATDIVVADFDRDGRLDFAVSNLSGDSFTARLNTTDFPPVLSQTALIRGTPATFTATGARPNEVVYFVYSLAGVAPGSVCPGPLGGMCLDLVAPASLIGSQTANAAGTAELTMTVPINAPAVTVWTQATIVRGTGGADSVKTQYIEDQIQ